MRRLFVTGIGTAVGKTLVSAILCRLWNCSYWKPVQAGDLHHSDSDQVSYLTQHKLQVLPERYRLQTASSPHDAAGRDGLLLRLDQFEMPEFDGGLIVEGAGGLLVPLNHQELMIDLIRHFRLPVVLVCSEYLGSINHSLLSFYALQREEIPVDFVVLNGIQTESTKSALMAHLPKGAGLIEVPWIKDISRMDMDELLTQIKITYGTGKKDN